MVASQPAPRRRWWLPFHRGRRVGPDPDVAFHPCIGGTGTQRDQRIHHVRQPLVVDLDFLDAAQPIAVAGGRRGVVAGAVALDADIGRSLGSLLREELGVTVEILVESRFK